MIRAGDFLLCRLSAATTHEGGIDTTAIVGRPPEMRAFEPGDELFEVLVHHTARIEAYVTVDCGSFRHTRVGARSWLMKHVHVGHDVTIGEDCELAPGVVVCGEVELGDRVRVGANAVIRPRIHVGEGARIGCGAVVVKDVPAHTVVVGNPARELQRWPAPMFADRGDARRITVERA